MKKRLWLLFIAPFLLLVGCQKQVADAPLRNSVYYQVFIGSFYDSDGDGVGDLQGVIEKLDYLQDDLGVSGIWLSPFHPSPTYHKYDVVNYYEIDPEFGTLEDFKELANEMAEREMDLMMDFVLNHTSSQHPWFIEAKEAALNDVDNQSEYYHYYNFSNNSEAGYTKLRDKLFYEAQFWSEMPDLNLDNPAVRNEIHEITEFWIDQGVNAFRLDATTHFYEDKIQKNTEMLSWFMDIAREIDEEIYVVGEAWTGESIVLNMYESEIDSLFNFKFSQNDGNIVKSINSQNGYGLAQAVLNYNEEIKKRNPEAIDAVFLSNHDNGRSAAYFGNQFEKKKLAASIYLLMPGNSFVYYGEEIGMLGSGVDENKRLPMQWGERDKSNIPERFPGADYQEFEIDSVEIQLKDQASLLAHYQEAIQIKNRYPEIVEESLEEIDFGHKELYALMHGDLLILHNLGEELLEIEYEGEVVEELNSKIKQQDKKLKLSPYSSFVIRCE